MKKFVLGLLIISTFQAYAQYGPGGIGDGDGTSGPRNVLWLDITDASSLTCGGCGNGDEITAWNDISGNGNHFGLRSTLSANTDTDPGPNLSTTAFGGIGAAVFDGSEKYLAIDDNSSLDGFTGGVSIIIVAQIDALGSPDALISKRSSSSSEEAYSVFHYTGDDLYMDVRTSGDNRFQGTTALSTGTDYILSSIYDGTEQHIAVQSTLSGTRTTTGDVEDSSAPLVLGAFNLDYSHFFEGEIAEVIIYGDGLTRAERIVVENYLADKYSITISEDYWGNDATYQYELAGIGQTSSNSSEATTAASGLLRISESDGFDDDDWLFWAHDDADGSPAYTSAGVITGSGHDRLERTYFIDETNDIGTVTVSFSTSDVPATGLANPEYYLYVDSDGNFSDATSYPMTLNGSSYEVDVELSDADFITIAYTSPTPAGISTSLAFWFSSQIGVENSGVAATDGQSVSVWEDLSANGSNGSGGTAPTYIENGGMNYHPVVRFDAASSEYLTFDLSALEGADYSIMAVTQRRSSAGNQYILGSEDNTVDALLFGYSSNTQLDVRNSSTASTNATVGGFDSPVEGPALVAINYNSTNLDIDEYRDGTNNSGTAATSTDYAATGYTGNLGRALSGNYLDGDIAEIVAFDANLSSGDYNALASQLAIKYGIDLGMDYVDEQANTLWELADNAGYTEDVVAIGVDNSFGLNQLISTNLADSLVIATSADFVSLNSGGSRTALSDGQFVFVTNDDDSFNFDQSYEGTSNVRMDRTWKVREVGSPGAITIGLKATAIEANVLLVSNDPTFASGVTKLSLASVGDYVYASHDFSDEDYFTFVNDPSEIWYSYISGNWSDPQNWTLDGAISALYVNPLSKVPTAGDSVVIKSGRTIDMDINNANVTKVEIIGTLDLASSSGHNLGYLEGNGTLRLSGVAGVDNYPTSIDTAFYEALEGGTVEYYGAGVELDQTRRFNNLVINQTSSGDIVLMTADSLYIYGDFTIESGDFQINNTSIINKAIEVHGDMFVDASGLFDVGTGNARHQLNLYGNFTNFGDVDFTNRASQTTNSEATNGIVDFNLLSDVQNQDITLEGPTHFYRIEVDKGTDKTYIADIQASDASFFELYGYANQGHGQTPQLTSNTNAIGLLTGTLKLGTNVDVGNLNTNGNYNINEGAELWIDGGTAAKIGNTAIVPYGNIRVSAGTLTADINSGITSRGNGTLYMEGGEVTIRQFRTSIYGSTNQGGIVMTGGILNITGGSIAPDYCPLNLTYSGNAFIMSGGTMNVSGANAKGGIFINSDTENILTGGSLNFISNTANPFLISTRAGFFNLTLTQTGGSANFLVGTNASGPGGNAETIEDLPLEILNDLNIDNSLGDVDLDMQGNNLEIQGSFNIDAGSTLDLTDMTLSFEGSGSSQFNIGLATTLVLDSLQINKNLEQVNSNISNGADPALQVDHYLDVTSGNFDPGAFNITLNGNLNVADTLGTASSTGVLSMTGSSAQTITSTNGAVYDLLIDNANGIDLSGDLGVPNQLALNAGVFDINTDKLTLWTEPTTSGTFSSSLMVQTDGNASDGGLAFYFDGLTADPATILYPIGTDANLGARYTPVSLDIENVTDDGSIGISLADTELSTTDPNGGTVLDYYWKMSHSGFTAVPDIGALSFTASELDDVDGSDGNGADDGTSLPDNWVTGKVENAEDSDDAGTGTFNALESPGSISLYTATYTGNDTGIGVGSYTLSSANYTLGEAARFATDPTIFYTRKTANNNQNWNVASSWSVTSTQGAANAPRWPGQSGNSNDIVIIGAHASSNHGFAQEPVRLNVNVDTDIAALIFEETETGETMGRVFPQSGTTHSWGEVSGEGELQLFFTNSGNVPVFVESTTDFGGFFSLVNSIWNLAHQGGAGTGNRVVMPSFPNEFPILRVTATGGSNGGTDGWGSQRQIEFANDITVNNDLQVANRAALYVQGNIDIADDLTVGVGFGHGRFRFPNGATAYSVNVGGDVIIGETTGGVEDENYIDIESGNSNDVSHYLNVSGNVILTENGNGSDPILDLFLSTNENQVVLTLEGEGDHAMTNDSNVSPDFYRLVFNKGSDTTSVFSIQTNFTLNGANTTEPPAFEIQKGKVVVDNSGVSLEVANGIDFDIPEGAGLEVTQGTITMDGSVVILDGLLKVNGGTVTLTDTDIEYSNTGYATVEISSGSFEVGNIFRRAITTSTGILKYRQTGGDVLIASDNAPTYSPSRASFEVLNPGSEFTLTGGTFTIQRGVTGDNNISLLLEPDTYDLAGSTINLGNANTPSYGANYFNLKSAVALNNLNIFDDGDDNMPPVRLLALPLTVNGTLDIANNAGLMANGFDVNLNGDFDNEGSYTNATAETTLGSTTSQSITGAGSFTIYDLTKTGAGEALTNQDLVLSHDLKVLEGILNIQDNTLSLKNDAYIESTLTNSSSSNGLVFNGSSNQDLYGVPNATVTLGTVTVENSSGVDIADGNGYNFDLTDRLRLHGGVFNIGGSLVTIKRGGYVEEVSTFNENNMVQTNSSFTDNGFRQEFFGIDADTTIFFPVGELKYTPVQFDFEGGTTQGDIRIRPANEMHPTVVDNVEPVTETEIVDSDHALQYYWIVIAQELTNATGEAIFNYDHTDANVEAPYDTTNYISARLLSNGVTWDKYAPTNFWGGNTTFRVPLNGADASLITGDYTAGVGSDDGLNNNIEGALPDELAQYDSNFSGTGSYSSDGSWTPLGSTPALSSGIGPVGAQITITAGDDISLDLSNVRLYSTHIESGAILRVPNASLGNRLGTVTGTGTIVLEDTELLPAGEYSSFLECDGGGLQYSGTTTYNVLSGISQIRNVTFDGSGTRIMPNNALDVCDVLTIDGPTVDFDAGQTYNVGDTEAEADGFHLISGTANITNGSTINVTGDLIASGGSLMGSSGTEIQVSEDITFTAGTLNWNNTDLILDGTTEQFVDGDFTGSSEIDNLTINNSSTEGVTLNSGDIVLDGLLTFVDGLLNNTSSETIVITSDGAWTGASSASYITGPVTKENIAISSTYEFPVGKASRYAPAAVANIVTGGDDWTVEYFTDLGAYPASSYDPNDPGSGKNAISRVISTDRWEVTSAGSNTAQVRVTYGPHITFESKDAIRVVWWDGDTDNRWENVGAVTSGSATAGTSRSEDFIGFSTQQFGLADAPEVPLPVDLVSFTAAMSNRFVYVKWQTASEINNEYFEVQRSYNGIDWEVIGTVDGAGDSNELLNYSFVDSSPYLGVSYYRLQQFDFDGVNEIFPAVIVNNTTLKAGIDLLLKPNPTNADNINFEIHVGDDHTPVRMQMINLSGRILFDKLYDPSNLKIEDRLISDQNVEPGLYFVIVRQGLNTKNLKLIIR